MGLFGFGASASGTARLLQIICLIWSKMNEGHLISGPANVGSGATAVPQCEIK